MSWVSFDWMKRSALAAALAAATVCSGTEPLPSLSQYPPPMGVSRWVTFGENTTERQIRIALRDLPAFSVFDYVSWRVAGDEVTLYGAVMNPGLRDDAESVVRAMDSVRRVHNLIRYLPNSPQDIRVRQRVFSAVYSDHVLAPYARLGGGAIRILVESGYVTLEGQVATDSDARRAAYLASVVPGVIRVNSHMQTVR